MAKKTYKNIGGRNELGIAPGETVTRELNAETEARLVARGAIEVVGGDTPAEVETPESPEAPEGTPPETPESTPESGRGGGLGRRR